MGTTPFEETTNPNDINYPSAVDSVLKFTLNATKSIESASNTTNTLVTFRNFRTWGTKDFQQFWRIMILVQVLSLISQHLR